MMNTKLNEFLMGQSDNITIKHDYSNELHYSHAMETLGGEQFLQDNYPLIYQLFENTKQQHVLGKEVERASEVDPLRVGFDDYIGIEYISYDDRTVSTKISADLMDIKPAIGITGKLIDKTDNDRVIGLTNSYIENNFQMDSYITKPSSEIMATDNKEFRTISDFYWMDQDANGNPKLASHTVIYSDLKIAGTESIVTNFTINDPIIKKAGTTRDYVEIVYDRTAQVGEDYDYNYPNVTTYHAGHKYVKIYIPVSGTVTVNTDFEILGLNSDMGFVLRIEDINKGVVNYYQDFESIGQTISADKKSITWNFLADWNNYIDATYFGVHTLVDLYNQMEINIRHIKTGMQMNITVVMDSKAKVGKDKSIAVAKKVDIYWGCLGKDSNITMADGSSKVISDILIGDMVMNEDKQPIQVQDIYTGMEKTMIMLQTTSGMKALLTQSHPVCTERGNVIAQELNAADKVKTIAGFEEISNLREVSYEDTVYSLKFETPNNIICNGLIVGDFGMQQSVEENKTVPAEPIVYSEAVINARNEFRKLFEYLNSKEN